MENHFPIAASWAETGSVNGYDLTVLHPLRIYGRDPGRFVSLNLHDREHELSVSGIVVSAEHVDVDGCRNECVP